MQLTRLILFLTGMTSPALAAEPTVTLTQSELATLIQGAVAEQQATPAMRAAQPVMDKVRQAFSPAPPVGPVRATAPPPAAPPLASATPGEASKPEKQ